LGTKIKNQFSLTEIFLNCLLVKKIIIIIMTKTRIEHLKQLVDELYLSDNPERDSWADYLFGHHIYLVADQSVLLARRF
jgi:hypothetical protein